MRLDRPRLLLFLALLLAAASTFVSWHWNTRTAGGADSYGYVSEADLWLQGDLTIDQPWVAAVPWPDAGWSFAPLGFRPRGIQPRNRVVPDPLVIVPIYSPGLPMAMAAAKWVGGQCALFAVVPMFTGLLVLATYGIGVRLRSPAAGLVAAWLVATSPIVVTMSIQPMSDVPAAAAWAVAIWGLLAATTGGALIAGLGASLAVLIRPNLVPVTAVIGGWILLRVWRSAPERRRAWIRQAIAFAAAAAPGVVAVALINTHLHGAPDRSGYLPLNELFAWSNVPINLDYYARLFVDMQTPIALAGLAALACPPVWSAPRADRAWIAGLLAAVSAVVIGEYAAYLHFDDWTSLRFLLPAWPAVMTGLAMVITLPSRWSWRFAIVLRVAALAAAVTVGVTTWQEAVGRGVLEFRDGEARYVAVAEAVRAKTAPDAVVFSMQHSGTLRYYGGRLTVNYSRLDRGWLDGAVAWLKTRGIHAYAVLEEWEIPQFRFLFGERNELGRLDRPPVWQYGAGRVQIFDLSNPPPPGAAAEPLEGPAHVGECLGPAPPPVVTIK